MIEKTEGRKEKRRKKRKENTMFQWLIDSPHTKEGLGGMTYHEGSTLSTTQQAFTWNYQIKKKKVI